MSYILDALKKSEQIRNQNNPRMVFAVQTTASVNDNKTGQPLWLYFVLFGIIITIGILSYWFYNRTPLTVQPIASKTNTYSLAIKHNEALPTVNETSQAPISQTIEASIAPSAVANTIKKEPIPVTPKTTKAVLSNQSTKTVLESPQPEEKQTSKTQTNLDDISLPKIVIEMHMYSDTPANRLVQINGKALKEGDEVEKGLKLVKITPTGVTLNYKSVVFDRKVVVNP